jgi:adenylate kinase
VKSSPPKQEGICDKCSSAVIQRDDETEEAISHRLQTYNDKTAPLIGFYEREGLLKTVTGTSSDVVVQELKGSLGF